MPMIAITPSHCDSRIRSTSTPSAVSRATEMTSRGFIAEGRPPRFSAAGSAALFRPSTATSMTLFPTNRRSCRRGSQRADALGRIVNLIRVALRANDAGPACPLTGASISRLFLALVRDPAMSLIRRISAAFSPESDPVALRAEIDRLTLALGADAEARRQREEMLQIIVDRTPTALMLVGETGKIVFTNPSARHLFFEGRDARGDNFLQMLGNVTEPLRRALLSESDQIFTFEDAGEAETYHLAKSHYVLDGEPHTLIKHPPHDARGLQAGDRHAEEDPADHRSRAGELDGARLVAAAVGSRMLDKLGTPERHTKIVAALQTVEERLQHLAGLPGWSGAPRTAPQAPEARGGLAQFPRGAAGAVVGRDDCGTARAGGMARSHAGAAGTH